MAFALLNVAPSTATFATMLWGCGPRRSCGLQLGAAGQLGASFTSTALVVHVSPRDPGSITAFLPALGDHGLVALAFPSGADSTSRTSCCWPRGAVAVYVTYALNADGGGADNSAPLHALGSALRTTTRCSLGGRSVLPTGRGKLLAVDAADRRDANRLLPRLSSWRPRLPAGRICHRRD